MYTCLTYVPVGETGGDTIVRVGRGGTSMMITMPLSGSRETLGGRELEFTMLVIKFSSPSMSRSGKIGMLIWHIICLTPPTRVKVA